LLIQNLGDELGKTDMIIEGILRKVEKTAMEFSAFSGKKAELTVGGGKLHMSHITVIESD